MKRTTAISFEDRMETVDFVVSPHAHITVDGDMCHGCTTRACVTACPANLFVPTADGGILFNYEQCFECGTCYLICNTAGACVQGAGGESRGVGFILQREQFHLFRGAAGQGKCLLKMI